jgi:hypothetical protein
VLLQILRTIALSRFDAQELFDLVRVLDLPPSFCTRNSYCVIVLEAVCLLCARFRSSADEYVLVMKYDRSQSAISDIVNHVVILIDKRWKHLLNYDNEVLLSSENLARYVNAIHCCGSPLTTIRGFINCTIRQICRPSWGQRIVYNRHKKYHAFKYQAVMLANGIIAHLFGPREGCNADPKLLCQSELLLKCKQLAVRPGTDEDTPRVEHYFQLFGDPAYGCTHLIQSPFIRPGQRTAQQDTWKARMSAVCIKVEHGCGIVLNLWPFLNSWWKLKVFTSPVGR